jgi:hypothetical protein
MAKIFGGSASRLEVYALFVAAVILIGGGIGGAIVVTSSDSKPTEVQEASVDTSVVDTSTTPTAPSPSAPTEPPVPPTTSAQRYYNPEPQAPVTSYPNQPVQEVAPQPIQDYSAYCTMPNLVGSEVHQYKTPRSPVEDQMRAAGCVMTTTAFWCLDSSLYSHPKVGMVGGIALVHSQSPAPGTLIHRSLGTYTVSIHHHPQVRPDGSERSLNGTNPC